MVRDPPPLWKANLPQKIAPLRRQPPPPPAADMVDFRMDTHLFINIKQWLIQDSPKEGVSTYLLQGLFARVGSGDPVRVLRLFHNNYSGYCCIHLLCRAMYNLSLPRLRANYYGLPTTVQLRAAHESRCSLVGVSRSTASGTVLYLP